MHLVTSERHTVLYQGVCRLRAKGGLHFDYSDLPNYVLQCILSVLTSAMNRVICMFTLQSDIVSMSLANLARS